MERGSFYKYMFLIIIILSVFTSQVNSQILPHNIDISESPNGIVAMPSNVPSAFNVFDRYTKVIASNGKAIHIAIQSRITNEQAIRAREILRMYLTDVPGSQYGANKSAVADKMADNDALLLLLNGSDDGSNDPSVNGQPLYEEEMQWEGHVWYINQDYDNHRDATFEEILHMVHDTGIGVDGQNTMPGSLPNFQTEIRAAQTNASSNNYQFWPIAASTETGVLNWYNELNNENSLTQEYLAAIIDVYYGLWGASMESTTLGMNGLYISKTRNEIVTEDAMGQALLPKFFPEYLTYTARIDSSFSGKFSLSFDQNISYTNHSQYLVNAMLLGSNNSNLMGNDQNNRLQGNKGNNILSGSLGIDTAVFIGTRTEYNIGNKNGEIIVTDNLSNRDGIDTLIDIEYVKFNDEVINTSTLVSVDDRNTVIPESINLFQNYPNPFNPSTNIEYRISNREHVKLHVFDTLGREVRALVNEFKDAGVYNVTFSCNNLSSGIYFYRLISGNVVITKSMILVK